MERKKSPDSTVQKAIQQHVVEHAERDKALKMLGHPLHPNPTPDVLTCVLPLGAAGRGLESEVDVAHLFLTIIQFHSACHLISQHTSTCIHNNFITLAPTYLQSPVAMGEWRSSRCRTHWEL